MDIIEQYNNILILIEQAEDEKENLSSIELLKHYINQAEQLLDNSQYIGEKLIKSLEKNFYYELDKTDQANSKSNECQIQFKQKIQQLKNRITEQQEQHQKLTKKSDLLISEINDKLEQGKTDEAQIIKKQYYDLIQKSPVISSKNKEQMLEKVRSSDDQLKQLTSWKNWTNNRERENLCQK